MQKKLKEISAQEAVYKRAMDEENELDKEQQGAYQEACEILKERFGNQQ